MNQYITGTTIRALREKKHLTQSELAQELHVSDKTVSKWETGKGYPDITLLEPLAKAFEVSVAELLSGTTVQNENTCANMLRSKFYVCPVCGNVIHSMGEAAIYCHGILLTPAEAETPDASHSIAIDTVEDEYFVHTDHPMTKDHYITFMAAVSTDSVQTVRLYPEGNAETRFKKNGIRRIYYYCNRDGLFCLDLRTIRRS